MKRRGWSVSWLGTQTGLENRLVPAAGIALDRLAFSGMRGKGLLGNALGALRMLGAFFASARIFRRVRADAVVGMDLAAARRAFEAVPWVRLAVVRRVWPDSLRVRLEEHRPVAIWGSERGNEKLVNSFGEVFEANVGDVEDDALPTLSGPDGSSAHVLAMLGRVDAGLSPLGSRVESLAYSGRGSWQATLDSGAVVELGRGSDDDVLTRAARFVATVDQVTSRYQRALEYADLRHHDGYAVRLKGVTTTLDATDKKSARK